MKPVILIGGETGYVGKEYIRLFQEKSIPYFAIPSRNKIPSLKDSFSVYLDNLLGSTQVTAVINAAGYTGKPNVDACEEDRAECLKGNVLFAHEVAKICDKHQVPLGHVSSGCIYTGTPGGRGFTELDPPNFSFRQNNCSFYSGTKALGEELLTDFNNVYTWRLRIPFDNVDSPRNYLSKLMNYKCLLEAENSISQLREFVSATFDCIRLEVPFGIYNVTNTGFVTTSGVVDLLKKYSFPNSEHEYKFFNSEEEFMKVAAKTPRSNCVLDNSKLLDCGIYMSESYEAVEKALKNWKKS